MAERRNMKVKMSASSVSSYLFLIVMLEVAVKSQMSSNSNSHAFLQTNNEVRYIVDNIPVSMHKEFSSSSGVRVQTVEESTMYNSKAHLKFEPSVLDFKERHLGVPHHEKVTILNLNSNKTVHMSSISGNTVHFHSSFFQDKVIPPLGNTSFNVVFLGREEGEIESSLFIHTSEGSFKYQVKGASIQSPYRLRPLSGVRLPLNASYSPLILMHNPHSTPLQLVEVYSSGGEFHLELPSGELEGPKHLWEIPAFLTKPIIRVRFHARAQKNHTAYIRLKVNNSEEVLVVPLEVEVGSSCGLYSPDDVIDFGVGGSHDPPKKMKLWVRNSWKKPIRIQNVINMPVSKALKIDFQPEKVPPDDSAPTQIAELTFDWKAALETGHTSGRIVVKSKQSGHKLVIPYTATVLEGGLSFDFKATRFRSDSGHIPPRPFKITNNYKVPVAITNVSLSKDANKHFEVCKFRPQILQPGKSTILLEIVVSQGATIYPDLKLESVMLIYTNISTVSVPLLCYNGKVVKVIRSQRNETDLELGTVGSETSKVVDFALVNENPVSVSLYEWDTSLHAAVVSLVAVQSGNVSTFLAKSYFNNSRTKEKSIGPGQYGVFRLIVRAGAEIGEAWGKVWVRTEFEFIEISAHMRIEHGSLQVTPDPIVFDDCFPGKLCTQSMKIQSLFSVAMAVTGVSSVPTDPRLSFTPNTPPLLTPVATSHLGYLTWDAQLYMASSNYLGVSQNTSGSTRWLDTLILPAHTFDYDLSLLAARYDHYLNVSSHLLNLSLRLDTTEVRDYAFKACVRLSWPCLVRPSENIVFPLTQVGNTSYRTVTITNPGTKDSLLVQVMLENLYPMAGSIIERLPERLRPKCNQCSSHSNPNDFIVDTLSRPKYPGIELPGVHIHKDASTFLLHPSANVTIRLGFVPSAAQFSSALLLIRNNLTVLETVRLSGTGAYAQFKFGNRKPGSSAALMFELAEKHLKDCEKEKQRKFPAPNLTVKRSFTARNTGALPITVQGFYISGLPCEGYGFRVLNCDPFYLGPNSTRKVDIAFTPDFTLARVQRTLSVWTSEGGEGGSAANYTLVATLPPYLLATCSSVLARPTWEPLLYYSAVTFMVFLLVCVLAAAFLESDRALKCALLAMSRDNATVQPVLDLRLVGSSVVLGSNTSTTANDPLLASSKGSTETAISSSGSSIPGPVCNSPDQEIAKEKTKVEGDLLAGVFTSSSMKCNKKKTDREKTAVSKRNSDPTDSSIECPERRGSWANVFNRSLGLGSQAVKQQTKTLTGSSSSAPAIVDSSTSQLSIKQASSRESLKTEQAVRNETLQRLTLPTLIQKSMDNTKEKRRSAGSKKNLSNLCSHKRIDEGSSGSISGGVTEDVETSSTTTESSSTHDDGDKEVEATMANQECDHVNSTASHKSQQSRVSKTNSDPSNFLKKITPTEQSGGSASSLEADWDEDDTVERETNHINSKKLQGIGRNSRKQSNKGGKLDAGHPGNGGKNKGLKNMSNKQQNRNKDKMPAMRKRQNDKGSSKGLGGVFDVSTPPPPPPPPAVSVWGESRATFSDVVARSDSYSSVVAPRHNSDSSFLSYSTNCTISQPTHSNAISASAASSGSASLGPIGPKKQMSSIWGNWGENTEHFHTSINPPATASSLFMDSYRESSTGSVQNSGFESVWSEPNLVLKMLQAEEQRRLETEEFQRQSAFQDPWTGVNSLWDPLYTPASSNLTSAGTNRLENTNSPLMWGNDVWAPTPPPTAPWAPPGLTPHPPPGIRINSSVLDESTDLGGEIDHCPPVTQMTANSTNVNIHPRRSLPNTYPVLQTARQIPFHHPVLQQYCHIPDMSQPCRVHHGLEYDPFRSLSTIWSPHTPSNIWNPPTTK